MEVHKSDSSLNPLELEMVFKWLDSFELTRCRRKLNRNFSDCVLLAGILKCEFPNLVELHNYSVCFAVHGKVENWNMMNRKVLKKLGINLKPEEIEKLAKADTNFMEEILFKIMKQIENFKRSMRTSKTNLTDHSSSVMTIKIWQQVGDKMKQVPQQMVEYSIYDDLLAKHERQLMAIEELKETIDNLQSALVSKTKLIEDLQILVSKRSKTSRAEPFQSTQLRIPLPTYFDWR